MFLSIDMFKNENRKDGSVMLPRKWSKELLKCLDKDCFGNDEFVFFEPTCGTGNIVLEIINKQFYSFMDRLEEKKDYSKLGEYGNISIIQTLSNLYAIDINKKYIQICRKRVLNQINFLLTKAQSSQKCIYNKYFMDVIEKAVFYHIHPNDMFSALETNYIKAKTAANKTRLSAKFF